MRPHPHPSHIGSFICSVIGLLIARALCCQAQQRMPLDAQTPPALAPAEPLLLNVTVTDRDGRYITGLSKEAFTVLLDDKPQEVVFFDTAETPVSIGIVLDLSGSMDRDYRKVGKTQQSALYASIEQFLRLSNP